MTALAMMMMLAAPVAQPEARGVVNLNNATIADLVRLPGVGMGKARRIVDQRVRKPFRKPEDLMTVKGFGPKSVARLRPYLTVSGPTTLRTKVVDKARKRPEPRRSKSERAPTSETPPPERADRLTPEEGQR